MNRLEQNYNITAASKEDTKEILTLYKAQLGREYCPWDEEYPSMETIEWDLSRNALFVLKIDGSIKAAISLEEDEDVENLSNWDTNLLPAGEPARLAVLPEEQNKGIGRIMLQFGMDELKRRGFRGVHFLVNKNNKKAIRCYGVFGFHVAGECRMYGQELLCYEQAL